MKRRLPSLLVLVFLAAAGAVLLRLPSWSQRVVAARLSAFLQREVALGAVRYEVLPRLRITLEDLRVAGASAGSPPLLEARRVVLAPHLAPFWKRRALIGRLHVAGLRLRVNVDNDGRHDLPLFATREATSREVRVDRLVVEDSAVFLNHQRVPLNVQWQDVTARLFASRAGTLSGRFGIGQGELRFAGAPPLPVSLETDVSLHGPRLWVSGARLRAPRTDLLAEGALGWGRRLEGRFSVRGEVDLGVMDRHVTRTGLGLAGHGRVEGELVLEEGIRFAGTVSGTEGAFEGVAVPRYTGAVAWDEDGLHLRDLELETLGGHGTLQVEIPPGGGRAELEAQFARVDAEALASFLFDIGAPGVGGAASGEAAISWPRGRIRELSGTATADMEATGDARTPLSGRVAWAAQDGEQRLEVLDLRTPLTAARLSGRIGKGFEADLEVDGETSDLAAADTLLVRLRQALGAADPQRAGLGGAGRFQGRWGGTLGSPVFEGRFHGQDLRYRGVSWGRGEWAGTLTTHDLRSQSLVVRRDGGELWLDGTTATGDYGDEDAMEVRLRLSGWPAEDLLRALEWDLDLQGRLTGEAEIGGRRSAPVGSVRLTSGAGRYHGVAFDGLTLDAHLRGAMTQVRSGRARVGGGEVRFHGTATDAGVYDGVAEITGADIAALLPKGAPPLRWGGALSGRVVVQGSRQRPQLEGRLHAPALMLGEETLGALEARLRGAGDGLVAVEGRCRSERLDLGVSGTLGVAAPYIGDLRLVAQSTDLAPFLRAGLGELPAAVGATATGEIRLRGPLASPRELLGEVDLGSLELRLPDYPVRNRDPLSASLRDGRLELREAQLFAEGTDLAVKGSVPLRRDDPLALSLAGAADLRVVSLLIPELKGRGAARLAVSVTGSRSEPRLDGTLTFEGATLRARGFPHGIEDVRGDLRFTEGAAHFSGVRAAVGGGPVEISGEAAYAAGRLRSFDVRGKGTGMALRYPEGLRSVVDADLRLFGDVENQWLTGVVDVRHAVWTRRYDVASELLSEAQEREPSATGGRLRLDVKVQALGTVRVDNNLAQLTARADLTVQGTSQAPLVLGRAEVEKGQVYFQGNTYLIRRGSLEFANPRRLDPLFDIEAETRVRSYRVTLRMNGTLQRVYPTLSADPNLSTVQILSLLAGADDATVESYGAVASRDAAQQYLAAAGAATLAAGRISEEVGLERGAAKLGLDRFSIDPSIVRASVSDPSARVTLGKRVTPGMNILYSVNLRGTEERLVSVEYTVSERLSVLMTREPRGFGFDLRWRQTR